MKYIKKYDRLVHKFNNITEGDFVKINFNLTGKYWFPEDNVDKLDKDMIYKVSIIDNEDFFEITITSLLDKNISFPISDKALIKVSKEDAELYINTNKYNL